MTRRQPALTSLFCETKSAIGSDTFIVPTLPHRKSSRPDQHRKGSEISRNHSSAVKNLTITVTSVSSPGKSLRISKPPSDYFGKSPPSLKETTALSARQSETDISRFVRPI